MKPPMVMQATWDADRERDEANAVADEREVNVSDVVREALERYVKRNRKR